MTMDHQHVASTVPVLIDMLALSRTATGSGAQWALESADLDMTLVSLPAGQHIPAHRNDEVDVLVVAVAGTLEVSVDRTTYHLVAGQALLLPKGTTRALQGVDERVSYLNVHRRRRGLWPTVTHQRA